MALPKEGKEGNKLARAALLLLPVC